MMLGFSVASQVATDPSSKARTDRAINKQETAELPRNKSQIAQNCVRWTTWTKNESLAGHSV